MKTLEKLRAELREKLAALQTLQEKAFADDPAKEDVDAFAAALAECKRLERQVQDLEDSDALIAKASLPANAPVAVPGIGHNHPPAAVKEVKPEEVLGLTAAAVIKGKVLNEAPLSVLEKNGYGRLASELAAAQNDPEMRQKAVNTLVSAEGGILVPAVQVGGIVPLLRQQVTFLQAGPTRIEFINGKYEVARGASGATAGYVGEGALKPVSTPTFDAINMSTKKLAGIVPMTQESRMWTIGNIEQYVRDDLRASMGLTMDLNMWLGTGAGSSPTGIFNKSGIQTYTPTVASPNAPTVAELDKIASGMQMKLINAGLYASGRWRWVMSYRTAMYLQDLRDANGNVINPGMQGVGNGDTLTWKGFPVVVTTQIPTNGGATTDEATLGLVDFGHVLFGEEMALVIRTSDQATLDPDGSGANLIHLWQMNMYAVLAESMHDVGLRYANAVVKATIRF